MKKEYINPTTQVVVLRQVQQLMTGSPGADSQADPNLPPSGGGSSRLEEWLEDDEEFDF